MADRLLLLIPGFQYSFQKNATLDELKAEISGMVSQLRPAGSISASTRGGLTGYTVSINGKTTELYEISWQDRVIMLNQKKLLQRILGGFAASVSWIFNLGVVMAIARNRVWLMWFLISAALMALWFYGIIAVALVAAGALKTPLEMPAAIATSLSALRVHAVDIGTTMQGWWVWVLLTGAFAAIGIRPDFIADLADLMQRYLSNSTDDDPAGLYTLVQRFRQVVYDSTSSLATPSGEEVLIVGHSFGTLLAVDAIASGLPNKVSLMTLGALFPFLMARKPDLQKTLDECGDSPSLVRWDDYFSKEDWFGSSSPLKVSSGAYNPHAVTMKTSFLGRFTLLAHHGYYRNLSILKAMLAGTSTA